VDGIAKKWNEKPAHRYFLIISKLILFLLFYFISLFLFFVVSRFTPRRKNSHWTELNKERARRLIKLGKMHSSGKAKVPDLGEKFVVPDYVEKRLKQDTVVWQNFQEFHELYKRIRISNICEFKDGSEEFERRIANFIKKTKQNKLFSNWNDGGRLLNY
jgi:uncharacterized protein YdeI (YjbR/CyaY-like superfamily)